ncbi:MAG: metal-dependent transcriptional regulator [Clostridiales bacterium]|nr:metal-dependent transcriptional regulator [Oscillospiraceae bacterium]MBR0396544.1 metal-dependent transcriptional regulator [Clostridiales bacterium]MBR2596981.1 metal-dependent transcriptional regulator [Clostridiales bacterium]
MTMQESGEMYLESILVLTKKGAPVRSLDVANYLGVSKPSVSRAMGLLKSGNYISIDDKGHITLLEDGLKIAKKIYERHVVITEILLELGVDMKTAEEDACRIEHVISDKTFKALKKHRKEHGK